MKQKVVHGKRVQAKVDFKEKKKSFKTNKPIERLNKIEKTNY